MPTLSREALIEAAKRAAQESPVPLCLSEFTRRTGISRWHIARNFPDGRWTELRTVAGIARSAMDHPRPSNDELLAEFHRVVLEHGRIPTWAVFGSRRKVGSEALLRKRFRSVAGLWQAYRDWLQTKEPESPILKLLAAEMLRTGGRRPASPKPAAAVLRWAGNDGPVFGPPLDFRGLRHAPINEQGVVYIFGMVSYELGFIVEGLQSSFPDCEAMRRTQNDRWQRVRIEFEFKSRNFHQHGHPPAGVDLIVCWEHDWPECPVEVLELKSAIRALTKPAA